jgi:hypothetical protein
MDHQRFDGLARLMGRRAGRRAGLRAVIGAALGVAIGTATPGADAARPKPEGPCGNGSRKANVCRKNSDCCTGICNTKLGKKNRDRTGRCRCVQTGKTCTADRNCCNSLTCISGVCGRGGIATGEPCVPGVDVCADSRARCTPLTDDAQTALGISGDYCTLPTGASPCGNGGWPSTSCVGGFCTEGPVLAGPTVCGSISLVDACTDDTNSGDGTTVYALGSGPTGPVLCGISKQLGKPVVFLLSGSGNECSADDECDLVPRNGAPAGSVCVSNTSQSSVISSFFGPAKTGICLDGAFVCSVEGDCPTFGGDPDPTGCTQPQGVPTMICIYEDD